MFVQDDGRKRLPNKINCKGDYLLKPQYHFLISRLILPLIIRALLTSFDLGKTENNQDWSIFGFIYGTVPPAPISVVFAGVFGIQEDMVKTIYNFKDVHFLDI